MPINFNLIYDPEKLEKAKRKEAKLVRRFKNPKKKKHPDLNPHIKVRSRKQRYYDRLASFNGAKYRNAQHRLRALQAISKRGTTTNKETIQRAREAFDRGKWAMLRLEACWVCGQKAEHRHHIVPLLKGGTNIRENLIGLCEPCHTVIHPWMLRVQEQAELDERLNYLIGGQNA